MNALLRVDKRSSASPNGDSAKTRVQMVLSNLKEDFLAIFFTHVDSSALGNGGFGIRARVGV